MKARTSMFPLLRAVRTVLRADADANRQALFETLKRGNPVARWVAAIHAALGIGRTSSALIATYGLGSFLGNGVPDSRRPFLLAVALHANARRQVGRVAGWFPSEHVVHAQFGFHAALSMGSLHSIGLLLRSPRQVRTFLRIVHRVNARGNFLLSCRVAAVVACYVRARGHLERLEPGGVLVSSDTNPEELGFSAAARSLGYPTIYVAHAFPPRYAPTLDHTLALLEGQASLEERARRGPVRGSVIFLGLEGRSAPMDLSRLARASPVVGLLMPKNVAWSNLAAVLSTLRRYAARILIRWHPNMLDAPRLRELVPDLEDVEERSRDEELQDVIDECDWIVSDPVSNVHLQVLKQGLPAIAIGGIGVELPGRADPYGFIANRVVYTLGSHDVLRLEDVARFYDDEWARRFSLYDGAYLRDHATVERAAAAHIRRTISETSRRAPTG